ncbi:hypothetical protein L195_g027480 [Trifolium pratense]|uniref:Uncharacterized protein n=1 Tax=Trifolium pratense TaxID=57577 RepID=A0A2K3KZ88_TRIPR|nr:hypothetical protein L195_g027480 [Trifolium pratense]
MLSHRGMIHDNTCPRVRIAHNLREGNACADYLAKLGARNNDAFSIMASPPARINLLLLDDASETCFYH